MELDSIYHWTTLPVPLRYGLEVNKAITVYTINELIGYRKTLVEGN